MNIYAWIVLGLIALEILLAISKIGKPRKVVTPGDAIFSVVEWGIIAWLIVMATVS